MRISFLELLRCICDTRRCLERGKIVWAGEDGSFTHVRIDGCMEIPEGEKRCDCMIFYFPQNKRTVVFVVEVKSRSYHFAEVQEKLENSIRRLESLEEVRHEAVTIPVLYARRHLSDSRRTVPYYKVSTSKGRLTMALLNYGEDICKCLK